MSTILDQIVQTKRKELAEAKRRLSLEQLKEAVAGLPRPRNFYRAATKHNRRGINLIAEVKRMSPSGGLLREDFDAVQIARIYHQAGADCISVLTDRAYFGGELQDLRRVREAVPLPVLRKDFIIDPYQVYEARLAGADAVLLIADILTPSLLMDLIILASSLNMTSLVEVHEAETLLRLRSLAGFPRHGYVLLGINNRDLRTMQVNIENTSRLASLVDNPRELVSESGIRTHDDVARLVRLGLGAVLIGEVFMRSDDIAAKVRELMGGS